MPSFVSFLVLTTVFLFSTNCRGQLTGTLAPDPIAVGYVRDLGQTRLVDYAQHLAQRLRIGDEVFRIIATEELEEMSSVRKEPVNGVAWFMVRGGLVPSFENITFQQVADEADVRRMLNFQTSRYGENGTLTGSDGKWTLTRMWSYRRELVEGQQPPQQPEFQRLGYEQTVEVLEEEGKKYVEHRTKMTRVYRLVEDILFESNFSELHDMLVPTPESLVGGVSPDNDLGGEAFPDRIPMGIKLLAWNMFSSTTGTELQQRDGEPQDVYEFRRLSGDLGLAAAKAVIFDVDHAEGWLRFADEAHDTIRAEGLVRTRRGSELSRQLQDLSSASSRFGPILDDGAAVTAHLSVQFPESVQPVAEAAARWFTYTIADATSDDVDLVVAADELGQSLQGIAEHGCLDAFLKLGWSEESGGVVYGGIRLDDNPQLLQSIHRLLRYLPPPTPEIHYDFRLVEQAQQSYIRVDLPEQVREEMQRGIEVSFTHFYITHQNGCLWFAIGSEEAYQIIEQSVARCIHSGFSSRTGLAGFEVDIDQWLSYPQDDATGIPGLLMWMDANRHDFPPGPAPVFGSSGNPTPLLQRVMELGGARHVRFHADADESGLRLRCEIGEAIGNYYLARMIDAQDHALKARAEAAQKQREAAIAAEVEAEMEKAMKARKDNGAKTSGNEN